MKNPFLDQDMMRLHSLIRRKATGTPDELARKMNCSRRTVLYKLQALKDEGFPIAWCPHRRSYYYTLDVMITHSVMIGDREIQRISGGIANACENFFGGARKLHRE